MQHCPVSSTAPIHPLPYIEHVSTLSWRMHTIFVEVILPYFIFLGLVVPSPLWICDCLPKSLLDICVGFVGHLLFRIGITCQGPYCGYSWAKQHVPNHLPSLHMIEPITGLRKLK